MFNFKDLSAVHVELTSKCQASCPMCARNHRGGIVNPNLKLETIDLTLFKKIFNQEVLNQLTYVYFCGNYGDPIIADSLLGIVEYCNNTNPNIKISIHTNGSARTPDWWKDLAVKLPKNHLVHFALDGLADTHDLYRIGTNFDQIIKNAKTFIDAGGHAEWVFLSFKHNEHQIEQAKNIAKELGFSNFVHKASGRFLDKQQFDVYNKLGNVVYQLEPPGEHKITFVSQEVIKNYKEVIKDVEINCMAQKSKEVYVDALGHLWPCCFLGSVPYVFESFKEVTHNYHADQKENIKDFINYLGGEHAVDLRNRSLKEIIESNEWQSAFSLYWGEKKLPTCARTCGKFSKKIISQYGDQFINSETINE